MRSELLSALLLEDDDWSFATHMTSRVDIVGMQGVDVHPDLTIHWRVDAERQADGMVLVPVIQAVSGHVAFTNYGEEAELHRIEVSWPRPAQPQGEAPGAAAGVDAWVDYAAPAQGTWDIETEVSPQSGRSLDLSIQRVEIDLDSQLIVVQF